MLQELKNLYHLFQAILASALYRFPARRMTIVGVTGTDGKTTTTSLIYWILLTSGKKVARVTTVDSQINGRAYSTSLHTTTPDSFNLQKFLRDCFEDECAYVVLEVSSHGITQNRIWGIPFEVGVLTNIANNEHLDFHGSFEKYQNAKMGFVRGCKQRVVEANYLTRKSFPFKTKLLGKFNEENSLAAAAACRILGISDFAIRSGLESFTPPPGRLEMVVEEPFKVIVDFGHTSQSFEKVLPVARSLRLRPKARLIHVFGATGDRDKSKRPIMGKVAAKYDDFIFLTHEDTYSENPESIMADVEGGLSQANFRAYAKVNSRGEAIRRAIKMAKPGDVVIITGVGHQKSMNVGGKEIPWSDQALVKKLINL